MAPVSRLPHGKSQSAAPCLGAMRPCARRYARPLGQAGLALVRPTGSAGSGQFCFDIFGRSLAFDISRAVGVSGAISFTLGRLLVSCFGSKGSRMLVSAGPSGRLFALSGLALRGGRLAVRGRAFSALGLGGGAHCANGVVWLQANRVSFARSFLPSWFGYLDVCARVWCLSVDKRFRSDYLPVGAGQLISCRQRSIVWR